MISMLCVCVNIKQQVITIELYVNYIHSILLPFEIFVDKLIIENRMQPFW